MRNIFPRLTCLVVALGSLLTAPSLQGSDHTPNPPEALTAAPTPATVDADAFVPTPADFRRLTILTGSSDIAKFAGSWVPDILSRYRDGPVVLVSVHGQSIAGHWFVQSCFGPPIPTELMVDGIRRNHPEAWIVLLVCNPGKHTLDAPGVSYFAGGDVWAIADSVFVGDDEILATRRRVDPTASGTLTTFTENPHAPKEPSPRSGDVRVNEQVAPPVEAVEEVRPE